jgi:CHAT domain-containing protein/tetratricopeptide (TPR) repeat protein
MEYGDKAWNNGEMRIPRLLALILLATLASPVKGVKDWPAGVVVESVTPQSAGAAAGFQPGDVLVAWSSEASPPAFPQPSGGDIQSPYDLLPLETEESLRRGVTLRGKRGDEEKIWALRSARWGIGTRPVLPPDLSALDLEGKTKAEAGDLAAAERSWRSAAEAARVGDDGRLAAWFLERLAGALAGAAMWPEADAVYSEALAALERESDLPAAAQLLRNWGGTFERRGAFDPAIEKYKKALAIDQAAAPKSLTAARTLNHLGVATAKKGHYDAGEEFLRQALAIREELVPGTIEVAMGFSNLGIMALRRGKLTAAEEHLGSAEDLLRRLAPESTEHALVFLNLGNVARARGDLEKSEGFHQRALAILEKIDPEGEGVAGCLQNLVNVAVLRGDLATADDLLRRILAIQERKAGNELGTWNTLVSLGHLAMDRGDLNAAEVHYRRGLAIAEKLSVDSREHALSLGTLGDLAAKHGDFATARTYLRRAQEVEEKLAPDSLDAASGLADLARLEMDSGGDLATAEGLLRRALSIFEKEAPESVEISVVLRNLGEIASRRGRLPEALQLGRRALDLQSKLAPGSTGEAGMLHFLGRVEREAGQSQDGIRDLCRAIDILDRQRTRLGGTHEAKTSFEASLDGYYHDCLEGLIELSRPAEAFHVLERGRARFFLALLAERDLHLSGLPPELAAERRHVNAEYDRVQSQLAGLSAGRDDAEIERLTGELGDLRARQEEIADRIRRESPRSAALHDPEPLDLAGARAALDPGTVLLEYAVGEEATWLFVVQPADAGGSGLEAFRVAVGSKKLREEVESFRLLLKDPHSNRAEFQTRARRLYDLLVRPAEPRIGKAQRILLSLDGPLHTLPFAALLHGDRYLVEWKPVHSVLSATVYAELTRSRPAQRIRGQEQLTAFGDPLYRPLKPEDSTDPEVQEAIRHGLSPRPLPFSSQEVKGIAALYPQARVYLGRDATEERAKSIGPESRLVHFACHGLLDERFPLNSALALTLPEKRAEGQDNGLLQAWEIFENVRLDADLVTLSACNTALGREMGGEGLVGLTRAFQYAGARSVLGSLWSVSDLSTARFMKRFYGYLRSGKPKDEALRAAQIDQIREKPGSPHPFHWAAFQLTGDWR